MVLMVIVSPTRTLDRDDDVAVDDHFGAAVDHEVFAFEHRRSAGFAGFDADQ